MPKLKILFLGCGFLATHIIPHIIPFSSQIILVDRERVEKVNYQNSIFPKHYIKKRKVTALAGLVQILSSIQVTPIHLDIKKEEQLNEIITNYEPDFVFVTFDNVNSRILTKKCLRKQIPTIYIGVSEGYIYIDWVENVVLPDTKESIEKVEKEMEKIRDVCTRLEFRGLGVIAAAYTYFIFNKWIDGGAKIGYIISVKDKIDAAMIKR